MSRIDSIFILPIGKRRFQEVLYTTAKVMGGKWERWDWKPALSDQEDRAVPT